MKKWFRHLLWNWDTELLLRWGGVFIVSIALAVLSVIYILQSETLSLTTFLMPIGGLAGLFIIAAFQIDLRRLLLATVIFDIVLQVDIYFGWNETYGHLGTIAGLNFSVTTIALAGLYGLWLLELLVEQRPTAQRPRFLIGYPILLYILTMVISVVAAINPTFAYYQIALHIQMFLLFAYIAGTVRKREDFLLILVSFAILVSEEGLYIIWQRITGVSGYVEGTNIYSYRVSGHFAGPNGAASFFSIITIMLIPLALIRINPVYKWLSIMGIGLGTIGLFLTLSRGGWASFIIGILVFILFMVYRGWLSLSLPMILALVLTTIIVLFPNLILNRIFGDDGGAAEGRLPLNELAISMIKEHPIIGVGANNFAVTAPAYWGPKFSRSWFYTVHNQFLLIWSETGILGFIAFLFFLLNILWRSWWVWAQKYRFTALIALSCFATVIGHAFHLQADIFNNRVAIQILWIIAGLVSALYLIHRNNEQDDLDYPQKTDAQ